jgi:hypothetical protein
MDAFRFTDGQWDEISAEILRRTGRPKCEEDRQMLEMICNHFAQLRPRLGRNIPTPAKARDAWHEIAAEARKLEAAIASLPAAGAADFTLLDWLYDGHRDGWKNWSEQLSLLKQAADWAAEFEIRTARKVSNAADPMLDGFVKQLAMIWKNYGGQISHAEDGPLLRFLRAVTAPVLIWASEEPMTPDALRASVRRIGNTWRVEA